MLLADVVLEIVELVGGLEAVRSGEELHEFPVALDDGAAGSALERLVLAVVEDDRVAEPVECVAVDACGGILEERSEVHAIHLVILLRVARDAGHGEDGGVKVMPDDGNFGGAAGLRDAGPLNEEGDADAAEILGALAVAEGVVGGDVVDDLTAVVAEEDHDGVVGKAVFLDRIEDLADAVVEMLDEAGVGWVAVALLAAIDLLVFRDLVLLGLDRGVDGVVAEVQEERFVLVLGDKLAGEVAETFGEVVARAAVLEVGDLVDGLPSGRLFLVKVGVEKTARAAELVGGDVDLEPLFLWSGLAVHADMPLADVGGGVSGVPHGLGECVLAGIHEGAVAIANPAGFAVAHDAEAGGVLPGHEGGSAR